MAKEYREYPLLQARKSPRPCYNHCLHLRLRVTSFTETFTRQLDARRGIDELIHRIDAVYDAIC